MHKYIVNSINVKTKKANEIRKILQIEGDKRRKYFYVRV
jgi:hypothetical protein